MCLVASASSGAAACAPRTALSLTRRCGMKNRNLLVAITLIVPAVLAACGGGGADPMPAGGETGMSPPPPSQPGPAPAPAPAPIPAPGPGPSPAPSIGANLVGNSGFEGSLDSWMNWGNAAAVAGQGSSGSHALRLGSGGGLGQDIAGIQPGAVYRMSGKVRVTDPAEAAHLGVSLTDAAGNTVLQQAVPVSTTGYYEARLEVRAPHNAARALVYATKDAGSGHAYIDDVALAPMGGFGSLKAAFIGNSLTYTHPTHAWGWDHAAGMAASHSDTDYAHLVAASLNIGAPSITNFSALEHQPAASKSRIAEVTADIDSSTVVVVQLGDGAGLERLAEFDDAYKALLDAARRGRSLLCVSTWWVTPAMDAVIRPACETRGGTYVYIGDIRTDPANRDRTEGPQYADPSVNDHPHDWSMVRIAERIVAAVRRSRRSWVVTKRRPSRIG